jgi:DNA-binding MarR family transcriptional regulator
MASAHAAPPGRSPASRPADPRAGRVLGDINFCLGRVYYAYVGLIRRQLAETGLDQHLAPGMGHVLYALFERDGLVIKEIAARTGLSLSTLTGMLRRMERAELIKRARDEADGRAIRVRLTALGKSLRGRCYALHRRVSGVVRNGLNREEAGRLRELLGRVLTSIEGSVREA